MLIILKPYTFALEILQAENPDMEIAVLTSKSKSSIMKKNQVKRVATFCTIMLLTILNASSAMAQAKVADKEIIGVWIMSSMKYEGESKELINDSYNQVKVYRANGEYACAEVAKMKDGSYLILPHEYGTYSLKNGMYTEMGRKPIKFTFIDKTHFGGRWKNRIDRWKKVSMPEKLTQYIVDKCKYTRKEPKEIQQLMKKHIFEK